MLQKLLAQLDKTASSFHEESASINTRFQKAAKSTEERLKENRAMLVVLQNTLRGVAKLDASGEENPQYQQLLTLIAEYEQEITQDKKVLAENADKVTEANQLVDNYCTGVVFLGAAPGNKPKISSDAEINSGVTPAITP